MIKNRAIYILIAILITLSLGHARMSNAEIAQDNNAQTEIIKKLKEAIGPFPRLLNYTRGFKTKDELLGGPYIFADNIKLNNCTLVINTVSIMVMFNIPAVIHEEILIPLKEIDENTLKIQELKLGSIGGGDSFNLIIKTINNKAAILNHAVTTSPLEKMNSDKVTKNSEFRLNFFINDLPEQSKKYVMEHPELKIGKEHISVFSELDVQNIRDHINSLVKVCKRNLIKEN